jgi:hypothetical protein
VATFSSRIVNNSWNGAVYADANTLVYLAKANQLSLLTGMNKTLIVTGNVFQEAVLNKPAAPDAIAIKSFLDTAVANNRSYGDAIRIVETPVASCACFETARAAPPQHEVC